MLWFVFYDITNDKTRNDISSILTHAGGVRVQYSGFVMESNRADVKVVEDILRSLKMEKDDKIFLIPTCKQCAEKVIIIK